MHCTIRRPDCQLYDGDATRLTARSPHGEFSVMEGHAPLVSVLEPGVLRVQHEDTLSVFVTGSGTLQVSQAGVQVLVEVCDRVDEVDAAWVRQQLAENAADMPENDHLKRLLEAKERYG